MGRSARNQFSGCSSRRSARSCTSLSALISLSLSLVVAGCDFPGRPNPADRPVRADQVVDFARLYGQHCAGCHGEHGNLGPAPALNDRLFREIVPEAELESVIANGRNKTLMPAFAQECGGPLTRAQIDVLVHEIKGRPYRVVESRNSAAAVEVVSGAGGITPKWGSSGEPPAEAPSYLKPSGDGNESNSAPEAASFSVFARACADCHGERGQGVALGGETLRRINDPVFLALCSDQVLRRYVITGRADLGMPGYAGARPGHARFQPLTNDEVAGLVALMASWREADVTARASRKSKE